MKLIYIILLLTAFLAGWIYGGEYRIEQELRGFWGHYYEVNQEGG